MKPCELTYGELNEMRLKGTMMFSRPLKRLGKLLATKILANGHLMKWLSISQP